MPDQAQDDQSNYQGFLDFELEIGPAQGDVYPVAVLKSPAGEARTTLSFPFEELALERYLLRLENALLRRRGRLQQLSDEEKLVQEFGQALFDFLLSGELRSRFDVSRSQAAGQDLGLRLKLRIQPPELAALPWEFLYDPRQAEYLCLTAATPIVRYLELPQPVQPLTVQSPLRVLGMLASPEGMQPLDIDTEKERLERALAGLQAQGQVQLTWLPGHTWRDLQRALRSGRWHIFHFIGHGGFDPQADEGLIVLENDDRSPHRLGATQLARLLADHRPLRLALLNACEGAHGGGQDIFSSTASILVRRGLPAVLAMQYPITDRAAIELTRSFYEALADGWPVDACVAEARKAISIAFPGGLEWGTPVLHLRAPDGVLFRLQPPAQPSVSKEQEPVTKTQEPTAKSQPPAAPELPLAEMELELAPGLPITFVRIPAGEFYMGSDKKRDPDAYDDEQPLHKLSLDEYWIGKYPITVAQFQAFAQADKYQTQAEKDGESYTWTGSEWKTVKGASWHHPRGPKSGIQEKSNHPVTHISWDDAVAFCGWAWRQTLSQGYRVRLPSEAEWEKAARGGLQIIRLQAGRIAGMIENPGPQRIYPWGDERPGAKHLNFNMNLKDTAPVGRYSPLGDSLYGCADLAGNVWEWTASLWGGDRQTPKYKYPYDPDDGREDPNSQERRVLRGGSFRDVPGFVRCACRGWYGPFDHDGDFGFRVVCSPI